MVNFLGYIVDYMMSHPRKHESSLALYLCRVTLKQADILVSQIDLRFTSRYGKIWQHVVYVTVDSTNTSCSGCSVERRV